MKGISYNQRNGEHGKLCAQEPHRACLASVLMITWLLDMSMQGGGGGEVHMCSDVQVQKPTALPMGSEQSHLPSHNGGGEPGTHVPALTRREVFTAALNVPRRSE